MMKKQQRLHLMFVVLSFLLSSVLLPDSVVNGQSIFNKPSDASATTPSFSPVSPSSNAPVITTPTSSSNNNDAPKNNNNVVASCTDYQDMIQLSPKLQMKYVVNVEGDNDLWDEVGHITIELILKNHQRAWIGLGLSRNNHGQMIGGQAVIGIPSSSSGGNYNGYDDYDDMDRILKYDLMGKKPMSINVMPDFEQGTLTDTSIQQNETITILKFTKLLKENGEIPINPCGSNPFIWAVGQSNYFSKHADKGGQLIDLSPCNVINKDEYCSKFTFDKDNINNPSSSNMMMPSGMGMGQPTFMKSPTYMEGNPPVMMPTSSFNNMGQQPSAIMTPSFMGQQPSAIMTPSFTGQQQPSMSSSPAVMSPVTSPVTFIPPTNEEMSPNVMSPITSPVMSPTNEHKIIAPVIIEPNTSPPIITTSTPTTTKSLPTMSPPTTTSTPTISKSPPTMLPSQTITTTPEVVTSSTGGLEFTRSSTTSLKQQQGLLRAHGIFAFIAWGILTPIAIILSLLVRRQGRGQQFLGDDDVKEERRRLLLTKLHIRFNMMTWIFTVIAFSLAVSAVNKRTNSEGHYHFQGNAHQSIGLIIFIFITLQVIGGLIRPSQQQSLQKQGQHQMLSPMQHDTENDDDNNNNGTVVDAGFEDEPLEEEGEVSIENKQKITTTTSVARQRWELFHKVFGIILLAVSWYQIKLGLDMYTHYFHQQNDDDDDNNNDNKSKFFYVILSIFGSIIGILTIKKYVCC